MKKIEMKTMKDCQDFHLKRDVLFSADVFGKFRNNNLKNYRLSPSHLLSVLNDKNLTWTYSRFWHVNILQKRYKKWNLLYF